MKTKKTKIIIFISILIIIIWLCIEGYKESQIMNKQDLDLADNYNNESIIENAKEDKKFPKEKVINKYKGYKVAAKLEIPVIKLETYILNDYSTQSLNVSVTKFWGSDPNEIGNFCVAGHNFIRKNMFRNLKDLKVGDKLFVSDNKVGKVEYKIYDLYKVMPEDISCLSQDTGNKREVTLITCTNNSKKRIIVKAREL
ncbi:MAG: sortase [Clostridia bacterium]|nr:sortase [Clostridia bacterium]